MSESFFYKTAKFTPTLLKSSVGKLNQFNSSPNTSSENNKLGNSFANTLKNTILKKERTEFTKTNLSIKSFHEVKHGETLTHIALNSMKKAGLKIDSKSIMQSAFKLAKYNGIKNPNLIIPGQKIDLSVIKTKNSLVKKNRNTFVAQFSSTNGDNLPPPFKTKLDSNFYNNKISELNTFKSDEKNITAVTVENESKKNINPVLEKTLNRAIDLGYISNSEAKQAKEKIFNMARRFKFTPDDFARVALMESDGFNPKANNGNCYGIIQFCDGDGRGAASVGLSHDPKKILELNVPDQLDLVSQYFEDTDLNKFKPASLDQLYLTILSPAARDVFNVNEPLPIPGQQAKALHVGGIVDAPITKASIVKGLITHAKNILSNHLFSEVADKNNGTFALNSVDEFNIK